MIRVSDQDAPWTIKISLVLPLEVRYTAPLRSKHLSFRTKLCLKRYFRCIKIALAPRYVAELGRAYERKKKEFRMGAYSVP